MAHPLTKDRWRSIGISIGGVGAVDLLVHCFDECRPDHGDPSNAGFASHLLDVAADCEDAVLLENHSHASLLSRLLGVFSCEIFTSYERPAGCSKECSKCCFTCPDRIADIKTPVVRSDCLLPADARSWSHILRVRDFRHSATYPGSVFVEGRDFKDVISIPDCYHISGVQGNDCDRRCVHCCCRLGNLFAAGRQGRGIVLCLIPAYLPPRLGTRTTMF